MSVTINEIANSYSQIGCLSGGGLASPQPAPLIEGAVLS